MWKSAWHFHSSFNCAIAFFNLKFLSLSHLMFLYREISAGYVYLELHSRFIKFFPNSLSFFTNILYTFCSSLSVVLLYFNMQQKMFDRCNVKQEFEISSNLNWRSRPGVGNLRPAGRIRPAEHNDQAHLL